MRKRNFRKEFVVCSWWLYGNRELWPEKAQNCFHKHSVTLRKVLALRETWSLKMIGPHLEVETKRGFPYLIFRHNWKSPNYAEALFTIHPRSFTMDFWMFHSGDSLHLSPLSFAVRKRIGALLQHGSPPTDSNFYACFSKLSKLIKMALDQARRRGGKRATARHKSRKQGIIVVGLGVCVEKIKGPNLDINCSSNLRETIADIDYIQIVQVI